MAPVQHEYQADWFRAAPMASCGPFSHWVRRCLIADRSRPTMKAVDPQPAGGGIGRLAARDSRGHRVDAVQLLLGHSKLESTVRYLGIAVDDALEISEQTEI